MGKGVHLLSSVDVDGRSAVCAACGPVRVVSKGYYRDGRRRWGCVVQARPHRRRKTKEARLARFKKDYCEGVGCAAIIEHACQLDVHHVDGNHENDAPENLMTLCANCHRLVTWQERH